MGLESARVLDIFIQVPQPDFHLQRPTAAVLLLTRRPCWPWPTKLCSCNEQGAHASRLMCFYCHGAPIRAVMSFNLPPSISLLNGGQDGGRKVTVKSLRGDGGCLWTRVHLMDKTFWQRCIALGHLYIWWEV